MAAARSSEALEEKVKQDKIICLPTPASDTYYLQTPKKQEKLHLNTDPEQ